MAAARSPKQRRGRKELRSDQAVDQSGSAFPTATRGQLGYRIDQVEEFLERARDTYDRGELATSPVTSVEVRQTAFALKKKGYSARFVDAAMDRLEEVFYERERRARMQELGEEAWWAEVGQLLREVRGRLDRPKGKRFRRRGLFASGYRRSQVDAFLDRVSALFAGEDTLSTSDVRSVVFHGQWRGYDEDQVDELLDAVIELLLATR
ncbi:MAG: DivIVA domain-containing protein [Leucobacter sp.]|nr:DivIVA domain-containing protein [Leucobacter sp.]